MFEYEEDKLKNGFSFGFYISMVHYWLIVLCEKKWDETKLGLLVLDTGSFSKLKKYKQCLGRKCELTPGSA